MGNSYIQKRIVRVISTSMCFGKCAATGFFIRPHLIATSFQGVFGEYYKTLREHLSLNGTGKEIADALSRFFAKDNKELAVELTTGKRLQGKMVHIDPYFDLVFVEITGVHSYFILDQSDRTYGEEIETWGFQQVFDHQIDAYPLTLNRGSIASFPVLSVTASVHEHIQAHMITLGGMCGAPVFVRGKNKVIGIVGGHMNWTKDDFAVYRGKKMMRDSFAVPMPITYITPASIVAKSGGLKKR